jgi:hypothetical protein
VDVSDLIDRQEITDVIKRLARGTDRLDHDLIASCYHSDGVDDHNSFRGSGAEFAKWVCEALSNLTATHHLIADPLIQLDGDVARCDTYCIAHHLGPDSDLVLGLRYVDRFEKRDGKWLIRKRVCAFDWTYTLTFDPAVGFQFGEDFTVGKRDHTDITYSFD